jgi:hypothetical protein
MEVREMGISEYISVVEFIMTSISIWMMSKQRIFEGLFLALCVLLLIVVSQAIVK